MTPVTPRARTPPTTSAGTSQRRPGGSSAAGRRAGFGAGAGRFGRVVSAGATAGVSAPRSAHTPLPPSGGGSAAVGGRATLVWAPLSAARFGAGNGPGVGIPPTVSVGGAPAPGTRTTTDAGPRAAAPPIAAGDSFGSSLSDGGGIGVATHGASAAITSAGVWYRSSGFFAIILPTTAATPSGTSGRSARTGRGSRCWCQISFWATDPSGNGGWAVSRK